MYVREMAVSLARLGLAVDIYTRASSPGLPPVVELAPGVRLFHLEAGPARPLPKGALARHLAAFLCSFMGTSQGLAGASYSLVHAHYWLAGWAASLAAERWGIPLVQSFHTLARRKERAGFPEPPIRSSTEARLARQASLVVAVSRSEAEDLERLYGVPPDRVVVAAPGVRTEVFRPRPREGQAFRHSLGMERGPLLLFAGRLEPLKGPELFVRALCFLPEAQGLVVGGGSAPGEGRRLERLVYELGLERRVRFLRPLPQERLAVAYSAADLVVVPSAAESFGLVALEAQACGTPVVAVRTGGLQEVVADGRTGVLLGERNPEAFARAIAALLASPALLASMRERARRRASRQTWEAAASVLVGAYRRILEAERLASA